MEPKPSKPYSADYDGREMRQCRSLGPMPFLFHTWVQRSLVHRWLFRRVETNWEQYWEEIYTAICGAMLNRSQKNHFGAMPFEIRMNKSGGWLADDVMFEIHFYNPGGKYEFPIWLVAFKGSEVIHVQPSY